MFNLKCQKCGIIFPQRLTPYQYNKKGIHVRKCCSRKCSNSKIQTKEINDKRRQTILESIKSGRVIPRPGPKGKNSQRYKEHGSRRQNKEIRFKTFDRYNGVCYECGIILIKDNITKWLAHHNNLNLSQEEYNTDEDRTLFCRKCHARWHAEYNRNLKKETQTFINNDK